MIDTKRLETDAAYWDECGAPEDATHYCELAKSFLIADDDCICTMCIPRPTKPAAPEYPKMAVMVNPYEAPLHYGEESLGKEIEVIEWLPDESCYVVRFDWGLGVLHDSMIDFGLYDARTAEQRHRDALVDLCIKSIHQHDSAHAAHIADAILSNYNLEPKE